MEYRKLTPEDQTVTDVVNSLTKNETPFDDVVRDAIDRKVAVSMYPSSRYAGFVEIQCLNLVTTRYSYTHVDIRKPSEEPMLKIRCDEPAENEDGGYDSPQNKAVVIVAAYVESCLSEKNETPSYEVYTVWFCKTLQNWKALCSTSLPDDMYYEVTYNGDRKETYLDIYKKQRNLCVED